MPTHAGPSVHRRLRTVARLASLLTLVMRRERMPSLRSLAERHGCHPRTIRRDLEALEAAGWSITWSRL